MSTHPGNLILMSLLTQRVLILFSLFIYPFLLASTNVFDTIYSPTTTNESDCTSPPPKLASKRFSSTASLSSFDENSFSSDSLQKSRFIPQKLDDLPEFIKAFDNTAIDFEEPYFLLAIPEEWNDGKVQPQPTITNSQVRIKYTDNRGRYHPLKQLSEIDMPALVKTISPFKVPTQDKQVISSNKMDREKSAEDEKLDDNSVWKVAEDDQDYDYYSDRNFSCIFHFDP